ncbi:hypothetical protein OG909_17530 [Streptomyces sp. NBC_01754]|uniref:hypothetical protein n=1 Tax=Streptomyces sp. NBC_01754 TaxID=2975930 RepID=UPI002DD9C772|nr:hypothetical protein [Streptomyces sp. NBC_01754]WSC93926.1 hypothetical protein OG909_17530 [Streptomyces sp. NBC_01754]
MKSANVTATVTDAGPSGLALPLALAAELAAEPGAEPDAAAPATRRPPEIRGGADRRDRRAARRRAARVGR